MESNEYLRESTRVLTAATGLVGSALKAAFWFRNRDWNGAPPYCVSTETTRCAMMT